MDDGELATDVVVIGGGPGGYVAAIRAGQLDLDVALVEAEAIGGECLNRGCIPSKALIAAAGLAHEAGHAEAMGVHADPRVDLGAMVDWKDGVVDDLTDGVGKLCRSAGVDLVEGRAEFVDETTARVVDGQSAGDELTVAFDHAIVATGSRPIEVPGFGFDAPQVLDAADALSLRTVPDDLVVVGGGYIGMELSTTFAKLGTRVTVVEMLDDILPGYEDDVTRYVRRRAEDLGIAFRFGESASSWQTVDEGILVTTEDGDGDAHDYPADRVLVAVGREPVTDTVGLDAIGLEPDDRGFIPTDDQGRTSVETVFAVGDVAGEPMLAHKASAEGEVAAAAIAGEPASLDDRAIPAAVFTDPEIGTVGMTAAEAEATGHDPAVGRFPFAASGRAMTTGRAEGFVRLVADAGTGAVLGGQVVGPEASELIAEIGLAIEVGATLEQVADAVHAHPTLAEATMEAARHALGRAIHTINR